MRVLAGLAVRAEPREVERAERLPDMLLRAVGPEGAEAFLVVWARGQFRGGVDVEVETLVSV